MVMRFGECGHPLFDEPHIRGGYLCRICDVMACGSQWTMRDYRTRETIDDGTAAFYEGTFGEHARMKAEWDTRRDEANTYDFPLLDEDFGGSTNHPDAFHVSCLADAIIIENILRYRARHAIDLDSGDAMKRRRDAVGLMVRNGLMRLCETELRAEWVAVPWPYIERDYIPAAVGEANPARVRTNVEPFNGVAYGIDWIDGRPVRLQKRSLDEAMRKFNLDVDTHAAKLRDSWGPMTDDEIIAKMDEVGRQVGAKLSRTGISQDLDYKTVFGIVDDD